MVLSSLFNSLRLSGALFRRVFIDDKFICETYIVWFGCCWKLSLAALMKLLFTFSEKFKSINLAMIGKGPGVEYWLVSKVILKVISKVFFRCHSGIT